MREVELGEVCTHYCGRRVGKHLGKTSLRTLDWDLNSKLVFIGGLVYYESDALGLRSCCTPVLTTDFNHADVIQLTSDADGSSVSQRETEDVKVKFETLRAMEQAETIDINSHLSDRVSDHNVGEDEHTMHTMMITPELLGLIPSSSGQSGAQSPSLSSDVSSDAGKCGIMGPKTWTQEDMELALDALRNHNMSLTKASATYGIPSTTLWQRAHRMGIDTPKKEGPTKSWTEENLNSALEALRTGSISANKASKAYVFYLNNFYSSITKNTRAVLGAELGMDHLQVISVVELDRNFVRKQCKSIKQVRGKVKKLQD
ncbi:unnamed protein product, partial [Timema podura]|nr:unnamed protein product [Timema podura]